MTNPFTYRPREDLEELEWEDNWVSNFMAWASDNTLPEDMCEGDEEWQHWSSKIANYFWAECSCCLFFRGVFLGAASMFSLVVIIFAIANFLGG